MKCKIKAICIVMIMIPIISYSHSGRTDSVGGHYDSFTGEYHYHHGYSAHQHPNGVCPYDEENEKDYVGGATFYNATNSVENNTIILTNTIRKLSNENKGLENQIDLKQTEINGLISENNNLQKKADTLCYIGITIVVATLLYICYLLKKIDELKVENKSK